MGFCRNVAIIDEGRIIGITTTDRIFNAHQRRAIVLRDKECLIPGCHVPASWCEIHHVEEHSRGGPTHTDNGVLLCWFHHRTIDTGGWQIRMIDGAPHVKGPYWWDADVKWSVVSDETRCLQIRSDGRPKLAKLGCVGNSLRLDPVDLDVPGTEEKRPRTDHPHLAIDDLAVLNHHGGKLAGAVTALVRRFKIDRGKVHF